MMANLSEDIQCAGFDTRPPMLDRSDFESWQQRIRLYYLGKDNGENILKSIDEGPFKMGKFRETLAEGTEGALHLGPKRDRVFVDLTPEEKGEMLLEGSELTKDECKSQLYDEFEHFRQNKGETIHEYYVRFVTAVKLNRGLKTSNYDQLYAYLKQHEAHVNENKMILERYNQHAIDPLAFVANVSPQQVVVQNIQGRQNRGQGNYARRAVAAGNVGAQNRVSNTNPGQAKQIKCYNYNGIGHIARQCTHPKRPQNSEYFKDKMLLMQAQENVVVLDEEQLLFIAGRHTNTCDDDVDEAPIQDLALNEDNTMFMANLSLADPIYDEAGPLYDSDILSEYVKDNAVQVIQSNVSSVPNDALMMIINDMHE
ncbi:retrovirus-related pol polyprotein from transposon TNT 1-94 [Tanacetum coccineum]